MSDQSTSRLVVTHARQRQRQRQCWRHVAVDSGWLPDTGAPTGDQGQKVERLTRVTCFFPGLCSCALQLLLFSVLQLTGVHIQKWRLWGRQMYAEGVFQAAARWVHVVSVCLCVCVYRLQCTLSMR